MPGKQEGNKIFFFNIEILHNCHTILIKKKKKSVKNMKYMSLLRTEVEIGQENNFTIIATAKELNKKIDNTISIEFLSPDI